VDADFCMKFTPLLSKKIYALNSTLVTVFPRPLSWRSLMRRGVMGGKKEGMRKGEGGEGQEGMQRNGREGDETPLQ